MGVFAMGLYREYPVKVRILDRCWLKYDQVLYKSGWFKHQEESNSKNKGEDTVTGVIHQQAGAGIPGIASKHWSCEHSGAISDIYIYD